MLYLLTINFSILIKYYFTTVAIQNVSRIVISKLMIIRAFVFITFSYPQIDLDLFPHFLSQ